jgi:hypothetical protein
MTMLVRKQPTVVIARYGIDLSAGERSPTLFNTASPIGYITRTNHRIH